MIKLNIFQEIAVKTDSKITLLLAPAGTGKTTVIQERVLYLKNQIADKDNFNENNFDNEIFFNRKKKIFENVVVTFSKRAANEIIARFKNSDLSNYFIGTFHSLAYEIIQKSELFINKKIELITDSNLEFIYNTICFKIGISKKQSKLFYKEILRAKEYGLNPEDISIDENSQIELNFKRSYQKLQKQLIDKAELSYDDFILLAMKESKKFKNIFVDEFQDIGYLEFLFLKSMVDEDSTLFIVGDDDQSIYGFKNRGKSHILNFRQHYANCNIIYLEDNYRSPLKIVQIAQNLISNNQFRFQKKVKVLSEYSGEYQYNNYFNYESEVTNIIFKISKLLETTDGEKIAILLRYNRDMEIFSTELERANIEYERSLGENELSILDIQQLFHVLLYGEESIFIAEFKKRFPKFPFDKKFDNSIDVLNELSFSDNSIIQYAKKQQSLKDFFENIGDLSTISKNRVKLYTIHSAKGLEFDEVFIPFLSDGVFPSPNGDLEEERRVFYVAITRAKKRVYISSSKNMKIWGRVIYTKESSFIKELIL